MDIRLGDLYDFIVRIVDDRLKQRWENDFTLAAKGEDAALVGSRERSSHKEEPLLPTLLEQINNLLNLQRQLLEAVQTSQESQKRIEALLEELLNLMRQQSEVSKTSNGRRLAQSLGEEEKPDAKGSSDKESGLKKFPEHPAGSHGDRGYETSSKGYAVMSPPDLGDEDASVLPSDNWLKEQPALSPTGELATDGISAPTVSAPPLGTEILTEQLSDYLRRLFGIDVDYLRTRQTPSSPSLQDAQVLVGEGTYNGQSVTLTIFGKSHITPTDVTVFYNAVVRPLRGSVTEPVLSIVFGETFEPKALKVAHALDLLVINLRDLREVS